MVTAGVRVDAKGEITFSAYNGKVNVSCKVEELVQYVEIRLIQSVKDMAGYKNSTRTAEQ